MSKADANGAANDATVTSQAGGSTPDPVADAERNVDAAEAKVKRQQEHLDGAKQAVTEAKAALAAAKKG